MISLLLFAALSLFSVDFGCSWDCLSVSAMVLVGDIIGIFGDNITLVVLSGPFTSSLKRKIGWSRQQQRRLLDLLHHHHSSALHISTPTKPTTLLDAKCTRTLTRNEAPLHHPCQINGKIHS